MEQKYNNITEAISYAKTFTFNEELINVYASTSNPLRNCFFNKIWHKSGRKNKYGVVFNDILVSVRYKDKYNKNKFTSYEIDLYFGLVKYRDYKNNYNS